MSNQTNVFDLDIEPEATTTQRVDVVPGADELALTRSLPAGFNLRALLTFLPDVRLKRKADERATAALAIDVTADGGLVEADVALGALRDSIADIERAFDEPTSLANALHKRMTSLRSDFCFTASEAIKVVGRRIYGEKQRLDRLADEARRKAQEEADRDARETIRKAAEAAKAEGAPKAVVQELKQQAKVATAPPVASPAPAPTLTSTSVVANWKCRLFGTADEAEPNPETADMTPGQQEQFLQIVAAVQADRRLLPFLKIDWSYANKRAAADKKAFNVPGLEAFDAGFPRAKGRRR